MNWTVKALAFAMATVLALWAQAGTPAAEKGRALDARMLTFTDGDGNTVRGTDFAGKWLLVYFGYSHCADLCPTGLSVLANALEQIGPAAEHIQPLFITVDPERDNGAVLRSFAQAFDRRMVGLGGSVDEIKMAAETFGISIRKVIQGDSDYVVDHTSSYTLVDPSRTQAEELREAEPHLLAVKLLAALSKAGAPLDNVNNIGAYR
jgi:cytochrome oxidase Cu insertion factor (SCO1/SenC/PrrC family)